MADNYEIHIDESGTFERFDDKKAFPDHDSQEPIRLIGGIVVPPELKERENHLRMGLMKLGESFYTNIETVTDIHVSDPERLKPGLTIRELRDTLLGFLNKEMREAQIVFIYDLEELSYENQLPGAQRYRSLLLKLLKALLFYHPQFQAMDSFDTKIAHRRVPYPRAYDLHLPEQGYLKIKDLQGKTAYTAITQADLISIMNQLKGSLGFESKKEAHYRIKPYHKWDSPFMVMADCVCNTVFNILRKKTSPASLPKALLSAFMPKKRMILENKSEMENENRRWKELTKKRLLFFCPFDYDFPESVLDTYYGENPERFLSKALKKGIQSMSDSLILLPALNTALKSLRKEDGPMGCKSILQLAHNILDARLYHLFDSVVKNLIGLAEGQLVGIKSGQTDPEWTSVLYLYHDVALRYNNHTSNIAESIVHRDRGAKILKQFSPLDVEEMRNYHEFVNRASVVDTNEFAFGRAIERLEPVKQKEEDITRILELEKNEILGKIYGSLAQNYTFLSKSGQAKKYFKKAAYHLGSGNPMQTSFRAHLAIEMKDRAEYEKEICSLFSQASLPQYVILVEKCLEDLSKYYFNLHLVLKGILIWPVSEHEKREIGKTAADALHPERLKRKGQHPWALIYIILGRLLEETGDVERALDFWQAGADFAMNKDQLTFIMIGHSARAWEALHRLNNDSLDMARSLMGPAVRTFQELKSGNQAPGIFNPNKILDEDGKVKSGWFDDVGHKFLTEFERADKSTFESLLQSFISRFTFNYW